MARKKEDNPVTEALNSLKYLYKHRTGFNIRNKQIDQIKLGKKTIHIDNLIPARIEDVFHNRRYEQKDGQLPVIAAKRRTEHGWHLIINLPPGVSFSRIKRDREYFQDAVNGWIELEWKYGKCHMNIQLGELPTMAKYEFNPDDYPNMELPIPIGYSRAGLIVLDLCDSPHLLIGGTTGFGKTSEMLVIIHSLIHKAYLVIIDMKHVDFQYLESHCLIAYTEDIAYQVLESLNAEYDRRIQILRSYRCRKVQECPVPMPYIAVVIDELAEIRNNATIALIDRLVRLARATGISIIVGSQRTSTKVIPGDTRANFAARLCFKVPSAADSRVILGEDCGLAGELPAIKGRCIYRFGATTQELQTQYLSPEHAEELIKNQTKKERWEANVKNVKPERKRLKPR